MHTRTCNDHLHTYTYTVLFEGVVTLKLATPTNHVAIFCRIMACLRLLQALEKAVSVSRPLTNLQRCSSSTAETVKRFDELRGRLHPLLVEKLTQQDLIETTDIQSKVEKTINRMIAYPNTLIIPPPPLSLSLSLSLSPSLSCFLPLSLSLLDQCLPSRGGGLYAIYTTQFRNFLRYRY